MLPGEVLVLERGMFNLLKVIGVLFIRLSSGCTQSKQYGSDCGVFAFNASTIVTPIYTKYNSLYIQAIYTSMQIC